MTKYKIINNCLTGSGTPEEKAIVVKKWHEEDYKRRLNNAKRYIQKCEKIEPNCCKQCLFKKEYDLLSIMKHGNTNYFYCNFYGSNFDYRSLEWLKLNLFKRIKCNDKKGEC